jgi:uncharacterized membrane protein HdeD (DUF308 family)
LLIRALYVPNPESIDGRFAMFDQLISRWWIVAARGLVAVLFGVTAFLAPEKTLVFFVSLFGVFALADGFFTIGAGLALNWLSLYLEGIVGGAVGLLTYFFPATALMWFAYLIVAWALLTGMLELAGAYSLRKTAKGPVARGEWLLGGSGLLSLAFAGVIAFLSSTDVTPFMWTIGGYALLSGTLLVALALNIRHWPRTA